jgi:hypothetical protein
VVPPDTKAAVLEGLARADAPFEAVPDLCEMAARHDPRLAELAAGGPLRIAACYPRAVRWLFASAGATLDPSSVEILNMRTGTVADVLAALDAEPAAAGAPATEQPPPPEAAPSRGDR